MYIQIPNSSYHGKRLFSVWSEEIHICPVCKTGTLYSIGRRRRTVIGADGIKQIFLIWRLKCPNCHKIQHELTDFMVPYKRYTTTTIEAAVDGRHDNIPCYDSTIHGFRRWFWSIANAFVAALQQLQTVSSRLEQEISLLLQIKFLVGDTTGWLKKVVWALVNNGKWPQTRLLC